MIVFTRKAGQEVVIRHPDGDEIIVRMIDIGGGKVRVGIKAPRSILVDRREVYDARAAAPGGMSGET